MFSLFDFKLSRLPRKLVSFLFITILTSIVFNVSYTELLSVNKSDQNPNSRQNLKSGYYNFIATQIQASTTIKKSMLRAEPSIVVSVYFFQFFVVPFLFIWFHGIHAKEYEERIIHNMIAMEGRYRYPLKKWLMHVMVIIPSVILTSLVTIMIQMNSWIAIDTAIQWRFILFSGISISLYSLIVITITGLISLKTGNVNKAWLWGIFGYFLLLLLNNTSLSFLSPAHYYYWIFHPNVWIKITQVIIYLIISIMVFLAYLRVMKKKEYLY